MIGNIRRWITLCEGSSFLELSPSTFDQNAAGWRSLRDHEQQLKAILGYLRRYAISNTEWRPETPKDDVPIDPSLLIFHAGQIYAMLGNIPNAVKCFSKTSKTEDTQWNNYVKATIAFLKQDRKTFEQYSTAENYNKETLDRLRQNWGQSYATAY